MWLLLPDRAFELLHSWRKRWKKNKTCKRFSNTNQTLYKCFFSDFHHYGLQVCNFSLAQFWCDHGHVFNLLYFHVHLNLGCFWRKAPVKIRSRNIFVNLWSSRHIFKQFSRHWRLISLKRSLLRTWLRSTGTTVDLDIDYGGEVLHVVSLVFMFGFYYGYLYGDRFTWNSSFRLFWFHQTIYSSWHLEWFRS